MHILWRNIEPHSDEMEQIRNELSHVTEGLLALPINPPGFRLHKAFKVTMFSRAFPAFVVVRFH